MNDELWWRHGFLKFFSSNKINGIWRRFGPSFIVILSQQEWQKHVFFPVENKTKGDVLASFCISNVFKRFFTRDARCFCELDHRQARALTSSKGTKPKWGPFQITSLHGNACALDLCLISHMSQFFSVHYTLKGLHNNDTAIEYLLNGKFITQFVS